METNPHDKEFPFWVARMSSRLPRSQRVTELRQEILFLRSMIEKNRDPEVRGLAATLITKLTMEIERLLHVLD